jgi:hypothetical protein
MTGREEEAQVIDKQETARRFIFGPESIQVRRHSVHVRDNCALEEKINIT